MPASTSVAPKQGRPVPPKKHGPPLPPPDRRMSLPGTVLRSPPPCGNNFPRGMDDLYLTLLDTTSSTHSDVPTGSEGKPRQRSEDLGVMGRPWYRGEMERKEAEKALRRINKVQITN
ncbi:hypothetical protein GDO78_005038 [Eleutherodactylus coqui]|uniref:Uncharacterized protein n=1 Tax=Eleutherodactylus coqui TaxID=57060 RepID=A0A8J6FKZ3_ELECQ|nr:hypothetical protein GDO78_005038 [Eleutherodactylus coqui]